MEREKGGEPREGGGAEPGSEARRFRVEGRVQGVGFRAWAVRTGEGLGLRGWVRNRADGSVELGLAGPARLLERMEGLLGEGPPSARVTAVDSVEYGNEALPPRGIQVLR